MQIGHKIKKFRELKGLSQEYMAEQLGMSQSNYHKIESSKNGVNVNMLLKISQLLDTNINEFFSEAGNIHLENSNNNQSVNGCLINAENTEKQNILKDYIQTLKEQIELLKEENKRLKNKE